MKKLIIILTLLICLGSMSYAKDLGNCAALNSSTDYVMINNVTTTGACLSISAKNDILLDCQGYNLTGDGGLGDIGFNIANSRNITIKNCGIANFGYGIKFDNVNNSYISNLTLTNATGLYIFQWTANNYNITIENSTFKDFGIGFYQSTSANFDNFILQNNYFERWGSQLSDTYNGGNRSNSLIKSNVFNDTLYTNGFILAGNTINLTFNNNTFFNFSNANKYVFSIDSLAQNVTFSDNTFDTCYIGINGAIPKAGSYSATDINIINNRWINSLSKTISSVIALNNVTRLRMIGNNISGMNTTAGGIYAINATNSNISNNIIGSLGNLFNTTKTGSNAAINLMGAMNTTISNNFIYLKDSVGILAGISLNPVSDTVIDNNYIERTGGLNNYGIILGTEGAGLACTNSNVTRNTVNLTNTTGNGHTYIIGYCNNTYTEYNKAYNGDYGYVIKGDNYATVRHNYAYVSMVTEGIYHEKGSWNSYFYNNTAQGAGPGVYIFHNNADVKQVINSTWDNNNINVSARIPIFISINTSSITFKNMNLLNSNSSIWSTIYIRNAINVTLQDMSFNGNLTAFNTTSLVLINVTYDNTLENINVTNMTRKWWYQGDITSGSGTILLYNSTNDLIYSLTANPTTAKTAITQYYNLGGTKQYDDNLTSIYNSVTHTNNNFENNIDDTFSSSNAQKQNISNTFNTGFAVFGTGLMLIILTVIFSVVIGVYQTKKENKQIDWDKLIKSSMIVIAIMIMVLLGLAIISLMVNTLP